MIVCIRLHYIYIWTNASICYCWFVLVFFIFIARCCCCCCSYWTKPNHMMSFEVLISTQWKFVMRIKCIACTKRRIQSAIKWNCHWEFVSWFFLTILIPTEFYSENKKCHEQIHKFEPIKPDRAISNTSHNVLSPIVSYARWVYFWFFLVHRLGGVFFFLLVGFFDVKFEFMSNFVHKKAIDWRPKNKHSIIFNWIYSQ